MQVIVYVMVYDTKIRVMICTRKKTPLIIIHLIIFYFNKVVIIRLNRVMRDVRIWVFRKASTQRHRASTFWLPYTTMESHPWAYPGAPYWFDVPFYPILIGNYGFFPCVPFQNFFFSYYQVWSVNSCYPLLRNWYHNQ